MGTEARTARAGCVAECAPRFALWLAWIVGTLAVCVPGGASAHESTVRADLVVQVGTERTTAVMFYEVTAGDAASLLRSRADVDRNGLLSDAESTRLTKELAARALAPVTFLRDGDALELDELEWSLRTQTGERGAVAIALLFELDGGPGRYSVEVASGAPEITLQFEAGDGLRIDSGLAAVATDGIGAGPWTIGGGDTGWVDVAPSEGSSAD